MRAYELHHKFVVIRDFLLRWFVIPCPTCNGFGHVHEENETYSCSHCGGARKIFRIHWIAKFLGQI